MPGVKVSGVYGSPAVGRVGACVGRCGSWPPSGVIAKTLTSDSLLQVSIRIHFYTFDNLQTIPQLGVPQHHGGLVRVLDHERARRADRARHIFELVRASSRYTRLLYTC